MRGECTPEQKEVCPLRTHFQDEHHLMYPKRDYSQPVEKAYRELPENKVQMCRHEHNELHATQEPPLKPSIETMAEAVLRSEMHRSTKVERQLGVIARQQEVATQYWGEVGARRE